MNKTHKFQENHSDKIAGNISIWRFLITGVQIPDTSIDQAHMQLSRSCKFAYADSSSNGILWNIETSFWNSPPWEVLKEQKRNTRCFFSENAFRKNFQLLWVRVSTFSFYSSFSRWRLRSFLTLAFLSNWANQWFFKLEKDFQWPWWGYCGNHWCKQLDRNADVENGHKRHHKNSLKN